MVAVSEALRGCKAYVTMTNAAECLENPEVEDWKADGGRVVGYFCSTVPEELFTAAGMLAFRMRGTGSTSTEYADANFTPINCSFPRHCFNEALEGNFEFLDALIVINSCDHVRRIYDNWLKELDEPDFIHVMALPRKTGPPQVEWYRDDIVLLKERFEDHFDIKISDDDVREAIALHNEIRALQRELFETRKLDNPPITGAEALRVMVAGTALPKPLYKGLLEEVLDAVRGKEGPPGDRARLLVVGSECDDPEFMELVEGQGAIVVTDAICYGTRIMWRQVPDPGDDPYRALAQYYVHDRPSCPRMHGLQPDRYQFVKDLCEEFRVDGVIGERMNFCDQWDAEHFMTGGDLKEAGIPFMRLEREYVLAGKGQLQTRVQAFVETLKGTD